MSTCNRLDLQTLGSQPILSKNLPNHWVKVQDFRVNVKNILHNIASFANIV